MVFESTRRYVIIGAGAIGGTVGGVLARADGPTVRPVPGTDTGASNSTWQSLSRNTGDVETDFFNGEIVRIAHQHGVAAPFNGALARLSRETVRNKVGPGHYSASRLAELLGC